MTEDQIELLAIDLLKANGYVYVHGSVLAPVLDSGGVNINEINTDNDRYN